MVKSVSSLLFVFLFRDQPRRSGQSDQREQLYLYRTLKVRLSQLGYAFRGETQC